ncbi:MAG: glycoside hydrolase family 5 protein [Treponema sp.]|jgi:endoglucanase|nr:glycoside hydrolase family 5 protein [Treponema sp.]
MKCARCASLLVLAAALFIAVGCTAQKSNVADVVVDPDAIDVAGEDNYTLGPLDFPVVASNYFAPFSKGVNFTEWFQSPSPQTIPFTKYTEETFEQAKSLGVDVVRLPLNLHSFTNGVAAGRSAYTLDPLFLRLLDQAVDWAEKHEMHLILDNHSFDPVANTPEDIGDILIPVWTQMADRYKDRSQYVMYEILNEPHGISDSVWGEIQGRAIAAIRSKDTTHTIIVGGTGYNSISALSAIPEYSDDNLIYTFHFYDPYLFSHQGETWGSPPNLRNLKGVPFPPDAHDMPATPGDLKGTWVEYNLKNQYPQEGQPAALAATLNKASEFSNARKAPVFCGEFGAHIINSLQKDRVRWYTAVTQFLDERGVARTSWDYFGGFGLFERQSGDFYSDLNVEVVRAMGFTPPDQSAAGAVEKIQTGFVLYDDYPRNGASIVCWETGAADDPDAMFFSAYASGAADGDYCLLWKNPKQYHSFMFTFPGSIDWAHLKDNGYALRFKVKTGADVSFDVRFVDAESGGGIPWRMKFTVDNETAPADNAWRVVTIPFDAMTEHGAWINATQEWLGPRGEFMWERIDMLAFVAEADAFTGEVWFDSIEVVKP